MPGKDVASEIRQVFLHSWQNRSSVEEWAKEIQQVVGENGGSVLCEHFIDVSKEGNIGNKLFYKYLEYALATKIVSFEEFFNSLWSAIQQGHRNLLSPNKFSMFVQIIETFLPSFRFHSSLDVSNGGLMFLLTIAITLIETIRVSVEEITKETFNVAKQPTEGILSIIHRCLRALTEAPLSERFRGYILISKSLHSELWTEFSESVKILHAAFRPPNQTRPSKLSKIQPLWIKFCHSYSLVAQPMFHTSKSILNKLPVSSMHQNADEIAGTTPWNSLMYAVQYEICGKKFRLRKSDTRILLESFRESHQWSTVDFYVYLLVAALQSEEKLSRYHSQTQKKPAAIDWLKSRCFLLVKVPMMISEWESPGNKAESFFYQANGDLDSIERALVHIFCFPALFHRKVNGISDYSIFSDLVRALEVRGLVSMEKLKKHLENKEIPIPDPMDDGEALTMENIQNSNRLALFQPDIETLGVLIDEKIGELEIGQGDESSDLASLLKCLVQSLQSPCGQQELLVELVMNLLTEKKQISLSATGMILSNLATNEILQIFHIHDQISRFITSVAYFCEEIGKQITIGSQAACSIFSPVFFLLVRILDKFEIKEGSYNQSVFIDIVHSFPLTYEWYSRYIHSFLCDTIPNEYSPPHVQQFGAFLKHSTQQTTEDFVKSIPPWQLLLCLPVHLQTLSPAQVKEHYHSQLVEMCKVFYPVAISLNELYNPIIAFVSGAGQLPNSLSLIEELHAAEIPAEAASALRSLRSESQRDRAQGIIAESEEIQFVPEVKGTASYTDFLSKVKAETNTLFTMLLSGTICLSYKILATFYLLLCRIGKREFVSTMLKEAIVLAPRSTVGYDSAYAMRAAELGGSILGFCGPEVVAEFLTQSLPLFVPVINSEKQAQMAAHFTWAACRLSQIFNVSESDIEKGFYSHLVSASRFHCLLFFTELLERQCRSPSFVLGLPVYFFSLVASDRNILKKFGSIPRVVEALRKLNCTPLCSTLFTFQDEETCQVAFDFYNSLI